MPTKTTPTGVEYEISGKKFTWHPEDDDGERGNLEPVVIPLRLKMKLALGGSASPAGAGRAPP